ncbi:hypothetical protein [Cryobacterium sp. W22_MBD10_FK3]|uniref:hypothetical protein n=1 Tax=Cryobacterium sp. W22_MBD10_FK3 TaxID=3240273 RepID=UPI003F8FD981
MELRTRPTRSAAICVASALSLLTLIAAPTGAWASDTSSANASPYVIAESLANIETANPSLLREPVGNSGTGTSLLLSGNVTVPTTLSDGVTVASDIGGFHVDLPNASTAGAAQTLDNGTVVYPGGSSANSVAVIDGGVQVLTTITRADAPVDYAYDVSLEASQKLELADAGPAVVNGDGSLAVVVGEAWAKNANGVDVPTSYTVAASTMIQTVDHTSMANVAYPVVADPIWLAPFVVKCLVGLGATGPQIAQIGLSGTPRSVLAALGRAGVACVFGK